MPEIGSAPARTRRSASPPPSPPGPGCAIDAATALQASGLGEGLTGGELTGGGLEGALVAGKGGGGGGVGVGVGLGVGVGIGEGGCGGGSMTYVKVRGAAAPGGLARTECFVGVTSAPGTLAGTNASIAVQLRLASMLRGTVPIGVLELSHQKVMLSFPPTGQFAAVMPHVYVATA